jgi:hypothetical protein
MLFLASLTHRFFIKRRNKSFILFSHFGFLRFTSITQIMILEKVTSRWNNMIWIQFNNWSIWNWLPGKTVISLLISIFILCWRNIDGKTLIRQIWIIRPGSKLNIVMFSIAVNRHHTLTVFIWILSVAGASNGYWIIFFLVEIRNVHLSVVRLVNGLTSIVSALGSGTA